MKKYVFILMNFFIILGCINAQAKEYSELKTVDFVDPKLYVGKWYEIASFPQRFQKGCVATSATYTLREDGDLDVLNECRLNSFEGEIKTAKGKAKIVDRKTNSKLKVSFFWPFYGKYWITDLGKNYEYAVVGHPDRDYLWILSRSKKLEPVVYNQIIERLKTSEYDVSKLNMTPQPE